MDDTQQRPTTWIVISAVLALVAIGLGIWAFTTKSDLDDANAQLDSQKQRLAAQQGAATSEEQRLEALGARERAAFRRVQRRFVSEEDLAKGLRGKISQEASQLQQTSSNLSSAEGQEQRDEAALKQAKQTSSLASACMQGAVSALNKFYNAANSRQGGRAAVAELEAIQNDCQSASGG